MSWNKTIFTRISDCWKYDKLKFFTNVFGGLFLLYIASALMYGIASNIIGTREKKNEYATIQRAIRCTNSSAELKEHLMRYTKSQLVNYIIFEWEKDSIEFDRMYGDVIRKAEEVVTNK